MTTTKSNITDALVLWDPNDGRVHQGARVPREKLAEFKRHIVEDGGEIIKVMPREYDDE